ncbi:hypothetical protein J4212_02890 [Candidatus Woesearchaeota archaeon]|nr:hypothetical protein [Candidatus Woesearchaeota archaeon]
MPPEINQERLRNLVEIYRQNIERELGTKAAKSENISSKEYLEFKKQYMPKHLSLYEKLCNFSEKIIKISPDRKKAPLIQENIDISHLNVTPTGVISFAYLAPLVIVFFGVLFSFALLQSMFFVMFFLLFGLAIIRPLSKFPEYTANGWRLKASNQMVLCVFYMVTYMRHTSNLENAIRFASDHLAPPLSLDLKKVMWDVETEKYSSVKESMDLYLETWKKWNLEFIEAFHLIESSLYEGSESRRLSALDKSLDVILDETYEKMLHYAHNLQSPITMLHMLGIILPILGLVILPLVVSFMDGAKWYHIAIIYNVTLPIAVYFMGKNILNSRPTGYGENDISEENPELKKYKNIIINLGGSEIKINPIVFSVTLGIFLLVIGLSPLILHSIGANDVPFGGEDLNSPCGGKFCLLEYRYSKDGGTLLGPYGLGAAILSLAIPLALGLSVGLFYKLRSKNIIKIRERSKKLEEEFANALFQLGNRLGDGLPAEIAFDKVANVMEGTVSGSFFELVGSNIRRLGMSVQSAIFDPSHGALVRFPSNLIESSMKVLTQSLKKGPIIAAQALTNVSRYIKEIHRVNERLKDLMADIISSMKSQIKFLTPAIAGIVIGITSMITTVLGKLGQQIGQVTSQGGAEGANVGLVSLFGEGIPTYYFQIVVGVYVVQITYILTILANGIENGSDRFYFLYCQQ